MERLYTSLKITSPNETINRGALGGATRSIFQPFSAAHMCDEREVTFSFRTHLSHMQNVQQKWYDFVFEHKHFFG